MVLDKLQKTVGSLRLGAFRGGGSSDRTAVLFRELQRYAAQFRAVEKESQRWQSVVAGTFTSITDLMRVPLPKTYEENHNGEAVPSETDVGVIGEGVNVDGLMEASNNHVTNLERVVNSTQAWLDEFREVHNKMKTLESIRNDLDARHRRVESLKSKIQQLRQRIQAGKNATNVARDEGLLVETQQQLRTQEEHVQAMDDNYRQTELETYQAEIELSQKCPQLKGCAAKLVNTCSDTFRAAYEAFDVSYGGVNSSYQSGTLDKSGAIAQQLRDTNYAAYPQSPQAGGWPPHVDGHYKNPSFVESDASSYNQPAQNHYPWGGAPKPDVFASESGGHMAYPKPRY